MEELEETEEEEELEFMLLRRCTNLQMYHQETTGNVSLRCPANTNLHKNYSLEQKNQYVLVLLTC